MDIGEIAEYLSETLTSLDIRGWSDKDFFYDDYLDDYVARPYPACFVTLRSALELTNLRVLKFSCPWEGGNVPFVLRGLPSLEELVIEAWGLDQPAQAEMVPALAQLPCLRSLELHYFDIGSSALRDVAPQLKRLETLKLTAARIAPGAAFDWVELLPSLRRLEVEPNPYPPFSFDVSPVFAFDLPPSVFVVAPASSSRVLDRLDRLDRVDRVDGRCPPHDTTLALTLSTFPVDDLCGPSSLYTPNVGVNEKVEAEALAGYCVVVDGPVDPPALAPAITEAASTVQSKMSHAVELPTDAIRAATALLPTPLAVPWAVQITRLTIGTAAATTRTQFRSLVECRGVRHLSLTNPRSEHDMLFVMAGMPDLETCVLVFQYHIRIQRMHCEPLKDLLLHLSTGDDGTPYARAVAWLLRSDTALMTPPPPVAGDDCDEAGPAPVPGRNPVGPPTTAAAGRAHANAKKKGSRHAAAVAVKAPARAPSKTASGDPNLPPRPHCINGLPVFRHLRSLSVLHTSQTFSFAVACRAPRLQRFVAATMNDTSLRDLVGSCPGLTSLEVHNCSHVTSAQYRLLRHLPLLDTIQLRRTTMGDDVKAELTDNMMWLRELSLHYLRHY